MRVIVGRYGYAEEQKRGARAGARTWAPATASEAENSLDLSAGELRQEKIQKKGLKLNCRELALGIRGLRSQHSPCVQALQAGVCADYALVNIAG